MASQFLLPVTSSSLPFAALLLRFASERLSTGSVTAKFLVAAKSRDVSSKLRSQFPTVVAGHEHDAVPDWRDAADVQAAVSSCNGVVFAAHGVGNEVLELPNKQSTEWIECEQGLARLVPRECRVVKLSWSNGLVRENSPLTAGRIHWEIEQELQKVKDLQVLRASTGMDAFLHGRLFEMVCGRTLSMSVKRGRVAFVHPLDVAETISALVAGEKEAEAGEGGVYSLTGPEALTFQDVATQLTEGIGDEVRYSNFPLWAIQPARWVRGVPGDVIEEELGVIRALEAGAQAQVDTHVLETLLGRPARSFRSFVVENKKAWPRTDPLY